MSSQVVYCRSNIFEEVSNSKDKIVSHGIIHSIMDSYSDVFVDLSTEEFKQKIENDIIYKRFLKRENAVFDTLKTFFDYLSEEDFSTFPTEIFLLNDDELDTKLIRETIGCFVYSKNEFDSLLMMDTKLGFTFPLPPNVPNFLSWKMIFENKSIEPLNSAILIDNFLYKNKGEYDDFKKENLFEIINSIINPLLKCSFHLTVVIDNSRAIIDREGAEVIITELIEFIKAEKRINLELGIITHCLNPEIHERALITNHHFLRSEKGFNVFINEKIVKFSRGEFVWVYNAINNSIGTITKDAQVGYLKAVKYQLEKNKTSIDHSNFNAGFINNRLFQ